MKIVPYNNDKYIKVLDPPDRDMLLGYRQRKGDPWVVAENNLVNQLVLGLRCDKVDSEEHADWAAQLRVDGLKDFQVTDVLRMLELPHCLNANPMGLGKTIETIKMLQLSGATNVLIVSPKIIRYQWRDQLKRWAGIDANVYENGCHTRILDRKL